MRKFIYRLDVAWDNIAGVRWAVDVFTSIIYADDGLVASRYPALLQESINTMTELFERVGLLTKTKKTQPMICVSGKVRVSLSNSSYHQWKAVFYSVKDWAACQVE